MKIILDQYNAVELLREGRIVRGQNLSSVIYVSWVTGESPAELTPLVIPEHYLAVEVNIRRPDGEQSGWMPCTKVSDTLKWYYSLSAWDTAVSGTASVTVRWYNSNDDTSDDTTTIYTSPECSFIIDRGTLAQPLPVDNDNYAALMAVITPLQSLAFKKYNVDSLPLDITYSLNGAKTNPAVYYNYSHSVYDTVVALDGSSYSYETSTKKGLLFVYSESSTKQCEFFFAGGKIYYRTVQSGAGGDFHDINESFNIIDVEQQVSINALLGGVAACYTKTEADNLFYTKTAADGRFYGKTAGEALAERMTSAESGLASRYTKPEADALLGTKQDNLEYDNAPTANSQKHVKSGGIKSAMNADKTELNNKIGNTADPTFSAIGADLVTAIKSLNEDIDSLQLGVIPRIVRGIIEAADASTLTSTLIAALDAKVYEATGRTPNNSDAVQVVDTTDEEEGYIYTYHYWSSEVIGSDLDGWYLASRYISPSISQVPNYRLTITSDSWSANADSNGLYYITVLASTHGMGTNNAISIDLRRYDSAVDAYIQLDTYSVTGGGNVTIYSDEKWLGTLVVRVGNAYYTPGQSVTIGTEITDVNGLAAALAGKVAHDAVQTLTEPQKKQARDNIGAVGVIPCTNSTKLSDLIGGPKIIQNTDTTDYYICRVISVPSNGGEYVFEFEDLMTPARYAGVASSDLTLSALLAQNSAYASPYALKADSDAKLGANQALSVVEVTSETTLGSVVNQMPRLYKFAYTNNGHTYYSYYVGEIRASDSLNCTYEFESLLNSERYCGSALVSDTFDEIFIVGSDDVTRQDYITKAKVTASTTIGAHSNKGVMIFEGNGSIYVGSITYASSKYSFALEDLASGYRYVGTDITSNLTFSVALSSTYREQYMTVTHLYEHNITIYYKDTSNAYSATFSIKNKSSASFDFASLCDFLETEEFYYTRQNNPNLTTDNLYPVSGAVAHFNTTSDFRSAPMVGIILQKFTSLNTEYKYLVLVGHQVTAGATSDTFPTLYVSDFSNVDVVQKTRTLL